MRWTSGPHFSTLAGMRTPKPLLSEEECTILAEVQVRLIAPGERERFDELICCEHYLHSADLVGEQLRYAAVYEG